MELVLGLKYAETNARLRKAIGNGTISALEIEAGNFSSYFTGKPIRGDTMMLVETDKDGTNNYFLSRAEYEACCPDNERLLRFHKGSTSIN